MPDSSQSSDVRPDAVAARGTPLPDLSTLIRPLTRGSSASRAAPLDDCSQADTSAEQLTLEDDQLEEEEPESLSAPSSQTAAASKAKTKTPKSCQTWLVDDVVDGFTMLGFDDRLDKKTRDCATVVNINARAGRDLALRVRMLEEGSGAAQDARCIRDAGVLSSRVDELSRQIREVNRRAPSASAGSDSSPSLTDELAALRAYVGKMASLIKELSTQLAAKDADIADLKADSQRWKARANMESALSQLPALPSISPSASLPRPLVRPRSPAPQAGTSNRPAKRARIDPELYALCVGSSTAFQKSHGKKLYIDVVRILDTLANAVDRERPYAVELNKKNQGFVIVFFEHEESRRLVLQNWPSKHKDYKALTVQEYDNVLPSQDAVFRDAVDAQTGSSHKRTLHLLSWNIAGDLESKLEENDFVAILLEYDVIFLQETHLLPGQDELIPLPRGYTIYSCPRPFRRDLARQWGGVLALVRTAIPHVFRMDLSSPDILVLDVLGACAINAYLAPVGSPFLDDGDTNVVDRYNAAVAACASRSDRPLYVFGDHNYRSGNVQPAAWAPARRSADIFVDTRGRSLTNILAEHSLGIMNGTSPDAAKFTSGQERGSTVIDYVVCNKRAYDLGVHLSVGDVPNYWSDHAPLCCELVLEATQPADSRENNAVLPPLRRSLQIRSTAMSAGIESLLESTLSAAMSPKTAVIALYGERQNLITNEFVSVYTDGSCLHANMASARAGAGACWGLGSSRNLALRVPAAQTSNRGELYAVLYAAREAQSNRDLRIFTDSEHVIHTFCHWAPTYAMTGWTCANADLIVPAVNILAARSGATCFEWVKGHSGNCLNEEADRLAKAGALLPPVELLADLPATPPSITAESVCVGPGAEAKVYTSLPRTPVPANEEQTARPATPSLDMPTREPASEFHRGREARRCKAAENLGALEAVLNDVQFWKLVLHVSHPRSREAAVAMRALQLVYMQRMNAPLVPPPEFDAAHIERVRLQAAALGDVTYDDSEKGYFRRKFSPEDVARLKSRIRSRPPGKSTGFDKTAFRVLMDIPNDALAELFNSCTLGCVVPEYWLLTILAGILKRGGHPTDPNAYRTIGLESCLLKFFMMLIDARVREWVEDNDLVPKTQNGFWAGKRTNNNVFILRCAAERACANKRALYVASVDIANAFPSVDHSILWLKLHALGMRGPLFDMYRFIYQHMSYCVRLDGEHSDLFSSDMGVLIGDPLSPIMWLLFFRDLVLPDNDADVVLAGARVAHLEQADDIVLFSTSPQALQAKLDALFRWCCLNLLQINGKKSWWMPLGRSPASWPAFTLNGRPVPYQEEKMYVGVTLKSSARNHFCVHTSLKADRAHVISSLIFGVLDQRCLRVPPTVAQRLYMALVDPHLTHGADISPDATNSATEKLQRMQLMYLRKTLRLRPNSCVAPLFSETGIIPIRYRRADLCLRQLGYALQQPSDSLVHRALLDSVSLATAGHRSWYDDLMKALALLPVPVLISYRADVEDVESARAQLSAAATEHVKDAITENPKLDLLVGRPNPKRTDDDPWGSAPVMAFRSYLKLKIADHREALTKLLLSEHNLAVERMRYAGADHDLRRCRFCAQAVEDPIHALFVCDASAELSALRKDFLWTAHSLGGLHGLRLIAAGELKMALQYFAATDSTLPAFARYVRDVLRCFDALPIYD